MPLVQFLFIIAVVIALSAGQVLFKLAAPTIDFTLRGALNNFTNTRLILALGIYVIATALWLVVLRSTPLRIAYPFAALAFFIVPVIAHFLLGESIGWNTFLGAALIAAGVLVSVLK